MLDKEFQHDMNNWTDVEEKNLAHRFPLHRACRDGNTENLKSLLEELRNNIQQSNLLVSEDDCYHWTAAHFAAYFGKVSN